MTAAPTRSPRWFFVAFLGSLGLLLGWFAWSKASDHWALSTRGQRVEAVIIRYEEVRGRRSTNWYPVFRFATPDGRQMEATSGATAERSELPRGQRLAVVYDPADPTNVRQATAVEAGPGVTPWILGVLALLMFALGAVFLLPQRAKAPG